MPSLTEEQLHDCEENGSANERALVADIRRLTEERNKLQTEYTRPVNGGRPMNRRKGRMVRASELIKEINDIIEKWGDTCLYVTGLTWGSVALWQESDYDNLVSSKRTE